MRLLVVEDDDDIAAAIVQTLELDGYAVDRAANGVDGLWMAQEGSYGVIVLDILMPRMNGYNVCRKLRDSGSSTPVLMLTAKVGDIDEEDGLDLGADDYLRKPFSPGVLQARIRALLRRSASASTSDVLERGGILLEPRSRRCSVSGAEVALSGRQAQLLEILLRTRETPLSRLQILDAVWGLDFDGDPNVVDVYLGYLRNKVGSQRIENVHGLGYRVRA